MSEPAEEGWYRYRTPENQEVDFLPDRQWQVSSPQNFAETIAIEEYRENPELAWPRTYEVLLDGTWTKVEVTLKLKPKATGTVVA